MAGGGGNKKIFQYCADPSGQEILYLRALQGHSGRNPIDPTVQDNVLIPNKFFEYTYHIGCASQCTLHHKFRSNSGRAKIQQGKTDGILNSCEFHAQESQRSARTRFDQTASCIVHAKVEKAPRYGVLVDIQLAQRKGLKFHQTRSNAIILYDTLSAYCISKAIVMKSEERIYQKENVSLRRPPKISYKDNWICDWILTLLEAAKTPNESNQNPKPNYQVRRDPYV